MQYKNKGVIENNMAVYTKITKDDPQFKNLIRNYNIGNIASLNPIKAGVQNTNYFINTDKGRYVFTIFEQMLKKTSNGVIKSTGGINVSDVKFCLRFMDSLAHYKIIPCPAVIFASEFKELNPQDGKKWLAEIKDKPCVITSFLPGGELETVECKHLEELGVNIAKMHSIDSKRFGVQEEENPNKYSLDGWIGIFNSIENRADEFAPGLAAEIKHHLDYLKNNWPEHLPAGIIHGDLFPDNVFFEGDKLVGIIDFYFACNDFFMYDLAICLNAWCFESDGAFNNAKAKAMLSSYAAVRPLCAAELSALPVLALGAAMRFLLSRLYDWLNRVEGALVVTKDPMEYLNNMRVVHGEVKSFAEYYAKILFDSHSWS